MQRKAHCQWSVLIIPRCRVPQNSDLPVYVSHSMSDHLTSPGLFSHYYHPPANTGRNKERKKKKPRAHPAVQLPTPTGRNCTRLHPLAVTNDCRKCRHVSHPSVSFMFIRSNKYQNHVPANVTDSFETAQAHGIHDSSGVTGFRAT